MLYVLETKDWGFFTVAESEYDALAKARTAAPACEKNPQELRLSQVVLADSEGIAFYCAT